LSSKVAQNTGNFYERNISSDLKGTTSMETNPGDPMAFQATDEEVSIKPESGFGRSTEEGLATARSRVRYGILALLFVGVVINYLDRANLALAAPVISKDLHLNAAELGLILSAFGWSYALLQIPGGFVLDRFGPRLTYTVALAAWSLITMVQGLARSAGALLGLRVGLGIAEAPAFPVNSRAVAAWFPTHERAFAVGVYTAGEFVGLAFLTPILALILTAFGWGVMFAICGLIGIIWAGIWHWRYRDPKASRKVNEAELSYIREGGGLAENAQESSKITWNEAAELFKHRQLWGIYVGQFAIASTLWFFLTWFPSYLVTARHLSIIKAGLYAVIPYIAAFIGVLIGGALSDWLHRRGFSVGTARKIPIIAGLLLASTIVLANYSSSINLVIAIMSIAFLGQGMSAISWTLVSDIAPKELLGLAGGVFNFAGNLGSIATPLAIGFILAATNSFNGGLVFISVVTLIGALSYIFVVGRVYRIELQPGNA
jgi:MFS transporter, ACS family, D-galactonate transporter